MGADMICVIVPILESEDNDTLKQKMIEVVDSLKNIPKGLEDYYLNDSIPTNLQTVKTDLKQTINDFFREKERSREVMTYYHKGEILYITGGMTWGDSPTATYDIFDKFTQLPYCILKLTKAETYTEKR